MRFNKPKCLSFFGNPSEGLQDINSVCSVRPQIGRNELVLVHGYVIGTSIVVFDSGGVMAH